MSLQNSIRPLSPITSRTTLPPLSIPILYFILIATLALPVGRYRALFAAPFAVHTYLLLNFTTGSLTSDYAIGSAIAQLFIKFLDFVVFSDAEREFHLLSTKEDVLGHESDQKEGNVGLKQEKNGATKTYFNTILKKFRWASGLAFTARGIGWSWEVKNVPSMPSQEATQKKLYTILKFFFSSPTYPSFFRPTFIFISLLRCLRFYLLSQVRTAILTAYPARDFPQQHVAIQIGLCFVHVAQIMFALEMSYTLAAAVTVGMRVCEPRHWPPAFGEWEDAYTLRKLWGKAWHQMERRIVTKAGNLVSRSTFNFKSGSFLSRYSQLYVAFLISSVIHHFGALFAVRHGMGEMRFFMSQAVAIMVEDGVIGLCRMGGLEGKFPVWVEKFVGRVWLGAWLAWSLRGYVGSLARNGVWV